MTSYKNGTKWTSGKTEYHRIAFYQNNGNSACDTMMKDESIIRTIESQMSSENKTSRNTSGTTQTWLQFMIDYSSISTTTKMDEVTIDVGPTHVLCIFWCRVTQHYCFIICCLSFTTIRNVEHGPLIPFFVVENNFDETKSIDIIYIVLTDII